MKNDLAVEEASPERWGFKANEVMKTASSVTVRSVLTDIMSNLNSSDSRPVIPLGHGDPSAFPCFRTTPIALDSIESALRSAKFNGYPPAGGIPPARKAVAEYLSKDLKHKLSADDVYLTCGCAHAIEVILSALSHPNANILLPRPGFPLYEARAAITHLEIRHFDLIPEKSWEVDLDAVEALADENTVGIVIINPGNPCGNVFTFQHLNKIAETARKLGILVIADEVYNHLTFGDNPFTPMGNFGSIAPVITVGSISKRWLVPGWRLGWLAVNDPRGILEKHGVFFFISWSVSVFLIYQDEVFSFLPTLQVISSIMGVMNAVCSNPATFIQGAVPMILGNRNDEFFSKIVCILRGAADVCYDSLNNIHSITCHSKPEGSMFVMVKLDLSMLEDVLDDVDFCKKLAKEESVVILPGVAVGLKNWLRVSFAIEPESLVEGLGRLKEFCNRHAKKE